MKDGVGTRETFECSKLNPSGIIVYNYYEYFALKFKEIKCES